MKKWVSICLVLILVYQCCSSISVLSWYLLKHDYITRELCVQKDVKDNCCKGQCYLEKQLKKAQPPRDMARHNKVINTVQPFLASDPLQLNIPLRFISFAQSGYTWPAYLSPCFKVFHPPGLSA